MLERGKEQLGWAIVFALNLLFLVWAWMWTDLNRGIYGGVAILWAVGAIGVGASRRFRFALLTSGLLTALMQFAPIVHYYGCLYAMLIVGNLGFKDAQGSLTSLGCLLSTVAFGGGMMLFGAAPMLLLSTPLRLQDDRAEWQLLNTKGESQPH